MGKTRDLFKKIRDTKGIFPKKFQMYKLGFEEAEEPEINLPTFIGLWRKKGS